MRTKENSKEMQFRIQDDARTHTGIVISMEKVGKRLHEYVVGFVHPDDNFPCVARFLGIPEAGWAEEATYVVSWAGHEDENGVILPKEVYQTLRKACAKA